MSRKLFSVAIALILLAVLAGVFIVAFFFPTPKAEIEVNVCVHLPDYDNQTILHLRDLNVSWVRTDWVTNNEAMGVYSQNLQDNGINLLAIINMSVFPVQASMLGDWNRTVTEIVNSAGFNNTDAVEICNEPNGAAFIPSETYYAMLRSAYTIIRNHTSIPIVFAGISPNIDGWQDYLNTVFAHNDTQQYFDCMGIHLYDDMTKNLNNLQFVEHLTAKPIWITETGQTSAGNGEKAQADYLKSVYSKLSPTVNKTFIYELKDRGTSGDREDHFGLFTANGTKKESYYVVWEFGRNKGGINDTLSWNCLIENVSM